MNFYLPTNYANKPPCNWFFYLSHYSSLFFTLKIVIKAT
jgi:hypothetical protein